MDNLLGSLIIAGTFLIPEVCLFFHHTLFRGNRTTKVSASSFEAFASPNCEPLARVTGLGVDVNWQLVRRPSRIARFSVRTTHLDTSHVACVRVFPGIKPEMIDFVLRVPNLQGLIIETFGMGNAPSAPAGGGPSLIDVIRSAVERGITVVNISQCTHGLVSPLYAPGFALGEAGVVFGHDLTSEAALTKLSYLLACTDLLPSVSVSKEGAAAATGTPVPDPRAIADYMARDLRGEMTELSVPTFTHPAARSLSFSVSVDGGASDVVREHFSSAVADSGSGSGPTLAVPRQAGVADGSGVGVVGAPGSGSLITAADAAFTALGWAIRHGDVAAVRNMLEGDEVNYQLLKRADYAGNTAVHLAAVAGHDDQQQQQPQSTSLSSSSGGGKRKQDHAAVLKELLVRGASVHARNRADNTPLFLARKTGNAESVALLEQAGAVLWEDEAAELAVGS